MGFLFGWLVFVIGIAVLAVDILIASIFERRLMKKSFAKIMKGGK